MDGWVVIGTDLDSKKFDKELKRLQKEAEKFAKEEESLLNKKAKLELDVTKTTNELDKVDKKIELINKKMKNMEEYNLPKNLENNEAYQKMNIQVNELISKSQEYANKLELQKNHITGINDKLKLNAENQEMVKSKIEETESKSLGLHMNFDNIGKSIMNNVKKIGKWALAVFSIRGAYMAVRQAMSSISTFNNDINDKLYSTKMIFTTALEPVVTRIVNLVWKLMSYINYISKAWFGIDLAAKASENSMKASAKSAKDMKKTLTGFDEANVLNENGTTSGVNTAQFKAPEDVPIPSWIEWIAKNKDLLITTFIELGAVIGTIKVAELFLKLKDLKKGLFDVSTQATKSTTTLGNFGKAIGTGLIVAGLVLITKAVTDLIFNWDELTPAQKRADAALLLLGASFTILGLTIKTAISTATFGLSEIIGIVTSLGLAIGGLITWLFSQEESIKSVEQAEKDLKTAQEELKQATDDYANTLNNYDNALKQVEESAKALEDAEKKNKMSGEDLQKQVDSGKLSYDKMTDAQKEVYKAYVNNISAEENLKKVTDDLKVEADNLTEAKTKEKIASWENQLALSAEKGEYDKYKKAVIEAYEKGELKAEEARDLIGKSMSNMSRDTQKAFMEDLPDAVKKGLDPKKYETFGQKFTKFFNGIWEGLKGGFSKAWSWIKGNFSSGSGNGGGFGGGDGFAKGGIISNGNVYGFKNGGIAFPKLQYCANGAIINQPGRGVPITQAVGGEAGAEGILPLTNNQQMDLLGASIAKHLNLNATIPIYMGSRQIAREFRKVDMEQKFATNL